jgi:DNA segregation ATPase FtsK/SpoIIIE, S-DNA-T family
MTEQFKLTGDRRSDSGLNDSTAFSLYTEAIDAISSSYDTWDEAQREYKAYIEHYRVAQSTVESLGYSFSTIEISELQAIPSASESKQFLKDGIKLAKQAKDLRINLEEEFNLASSSLEQKRKQLKQKEEEFHLEFSQLEIRLDNVSLKDATELQYINTSLQINSSNDAIFNPTAGFSIIIALFIAFSVGDFWRALILLPFIFGMVFAVLYPIFIVIRLGTANSVELRKRKSYLIECRDLEESSIKRKQEELLERHDLEFSEFQRTINQIENYLIQCETENPKEIKVAERFAFEHLKYFTVYLATAKLMALESVPQDFARSRQEQKINLGHSFAYWEHDIHHNSPKMFARPWSDPGWESSYEPRFDGNIPDCVCIGQFLLENVDTGLNKSTPSIEIPAMLPIRAFQNARGDRFPGHIVIMSDVKTRQSVLETIESLAVRLLSTFPVRKLKGSFIDPIALGNTFPFKELPKSVLSGQQIFTNSQDIREELKTLVTHIEQIIQNYLGRKYNNLEDYNAASDAIQEAYRYLFLADFPTAFDPQTANELKSIITNGSRAGVYTIIHVDLSKEKLHSFDYALFDQYCTVIRPTNQSHKGQPLFEVKMPNGWKRELILDRPPSREIHQHIIQSILATEKTIKVETLPFKSIYPETFWQSNSKQELRAPIGVCGAKDPLEFWLGENHEKIAVSSGLLAGKPGAGKSYTLHSIILSLAMQYSPAELELYLLDYKEGVEFQTYVDPNRSETQNHNSELDETCALPHAKVISIESDREFGLSVLQSIQKEIETRGQLFKDIGVSELKDYREKTNKQIPRILVVIDEFQYMFQDNDTITRELNLLYEDITRRGRAFGIHLLLASQSLNINNINNRIYGFIPLRMAMQMDQTTANIVLAEGNTDAVELLDRSGRIICNTDFGRKRANQLGQIADISLPERQNAMKAIYEQATTSNYQRPQPLTLFQGNRPSKLSQNGQFLRLTQLDRWLPSSELNKQIIQNQDWLAPEVPSALWIGEAMRIGHHTQAILRRRARSNMLLIGQSENNIFGMISGALLSLVHIHAPTPTKVHSGAEFHLIDLSQTDDDDTLSNLTTTFQSAFKSLYPIKLGKRFPDSEQGIKRAEKVLEELHEILQARKQIRDADPDEMNFGPSIFFVAAIGALNRAQYLRPIAGQRNDEMSPQAKQLQEIATLGPELGIHTILWLDNSTTFQQLCANNNARTLLSQFDCRTVLKLSTEDSRFFLGEPIAHNLPSLRGYFYDASLSEGYEKFKPYAIPTSTEIEQYAQALTNRPQ